MIVRLKPLGDECTLLIKKSLFFPYDTGNLKFNATSGELTQKDTYRIKFDLTRAPYIPYLQYGTDAHNIPRAFGRNLPFGIGGRFNGKFHPGSRKHEGFIDKLVEESARYIATKYKGELQKI